MNTLKKDTLLLSSSLTLIFSLSACITPDSPKSSTSSSSSKPSPSASSKSAADILRKSATAMKQLTSTHMTVSLSTSSTETTPASSSPSRLARTLTTTAEADVVLPDQTQISFKPLSLTTPPKISQVVKAEQVYMQTLKGKWYAFSGDAAKCLSSERPPVTQYPLSLAALLPFAQGSTFPDHGTQKLGGKSLRHISVPVGHDAFDALRELAMVESVLDGKTHQQLVKVEKGALDVWIDETTSHVYHLTLQTQTSLDRGLLPSRGPATPASSLIRKTTKDLTVDFSQFNHMTSISTPTNAMAYTTSAPPALPGLCPVQLRTVLDAS